VRVCAMTLSPCFYKFCAGVLPAARPGSFTLDGV
jgi:hypothetical protein